MPEAELKSIINGISEVHSKKLGEDLMQCIDLLLNSEDMISSKYMRLKTAARLFSECLKWRGNGPVPDLFQMAMDYLPDEKMRQSFYSMIEGMNGEDKKNPPNLVNGIILRQAQDDNHSDIAPCHSELVELLSNHDRQLARLSQFDGVESRKFL